MQVVQVEDKAGHIMPGLNMKMYLKYINILQINNMVGLLQLIIAQYQRNFKETILIHIT